jgi:hypothetical protein
VSARPRVAATCRWLAVLPGAFIGAGVLQAVLIVAHPLLIGDAHSHLGQLLTRTFVNVAFGAAVVGIASAIAPSHKVAAAITVAALFIAASAGVWLTRIDVRAGWDGYATIVSVIAVVVTAVDIARRQPCSRHAALSATRR